MFDAIVSLLVAASVASGAIVPRQEGCQTIAEIATANPELSVLVELVTLAELGGAFTNETIDITLFAPLNSAFEQLDNETMAFLRDPANKQALEFGLSYHVYGEAVYAANATNSTISMANGQDANVTVAYDQSIFINDAKVITSDIEACNGVIHTIDMVLNPPDTSCMLLSAIIEQDPELTALYDLLETANLTDLLTDPSLNVTIFAPTDEAFLAVPNATIEFLTDPANSQALVSALVYHTYPGTILTTDAFNTTITMSNEDDANVTVTTSGTVLINDAQVIEGDIIACNGALHKIDTVLTPPSLA